METQTEAPVVTSSIINQGLFSLWDDFNENEESKTSVPSKDPLELYLNFKACILDKTSDLGGKSKNSKDKSSGYLELDQELADYKDSILSIRKKIKNENKTKGKFGMSYTSVCNLTMDVYLL